MGPFYSIKVRAEKITASAPWGKSLLQFAVITAFAQTSSEEALVWALLRNTGEVPPEPGWDDFTMANPRVVPPRAQI